MQRRPVHQGLDSTELKDDSLFKITKQITLHLMMSISHLRLMLIFTVPFFKKSKIKVMRPSVRPFVRSLLNDSLDGSQCGVVLENE